MIKKTVAFIGRTIAFGFEKEPMITAGVLTVLTLLLGCLLIRLAQ